MNLSSSLDLDSITIHLKAIRECRFFGFSATLLVHIEEIDKCIGQTLLPYEIKESLKAFYRIETVDQWSFYVRHIELLLKEYKVKIFYWSTVDSIQTYRDPYLYHDMGLT